MKHFFLLLNCIGVCYKPCVAAAERVEAKAVCVTRLRLRHAQATATCIVTLLLLWVVFLAGCSFGSQTVSAHAPLIEESVHQQILNATVQIKLIAPLTDAVGEPVVAASNGEWHVQNATAYGLGSLIKENGQIFIVTHDHWGDILIQTEKVEFKNADGVLIAEISGIFFRNLIRYRDDGTLLLQAPQALESMFGQAVDKGDSAEIANDSEVFLTRHQAGNDRVEVVAARVTAVATTSTIPTYDLLSLDGSPVVKGDSGGGIWSDGKLVGNMWWTVLEESASQRIQTDASGAAAYTESIHQSLEAPQPDMFSAGGTVQSP